MIAKVIEDVERVGAMPSNCKLLHAHVIDANPAYVAFNLQSEDIIEESRSFLRSEDVHTLGRYGRWEYSSMAQVIQNGIDLGSDLATTMGSKR